MSCHTSPTWIHMVRVYKTLESNPQIADECLWTMASLSRVEDWEKEQPMIGHWLPEATSRDWSDRQLHCSWAAWCRVLGQSHGRVPHFQCFRFHALSRHSLNTRYRDWGSSWQGDRAPFPVSQLLSVFHGLFVRICSGIDTASQFVVPRLDLKPTGKEPNRW